MKDQLRFASFRGSEVNVRSVVSFQTMSHYSQYAEDLWNWRYLNGPAGEGVISLGLDRDKIVGHNALARLKCASRNVEVMGGMSGGTLVDPEYRGRGIFKVIRKHEDNKAKTIGIAVLLGFPNKISTNNFVRSGYKIHQSANVVYKPLGILNRENIKNVRVFINRFIANTIKKGIKKADQAYKSDQTAGEEIRVEMIKTFGSETEKLWNWVRKEHYVGIVKDSEYLNWRYYRRPNTDIIAVMGFKKNEPKALCIIEKDRMSRKPVKGFVSELLARNEDEDAAFVALIRGEDEARKNGMVGIWALSDGGSVISSLAMRNGYYTKSVRPFIVNILDKNMENLFVSPWNLSMGDYYAGRGLRNQ